MEHTRLLPEHTRFNPGTAHLCNLVKQTRYHTPSVLKSATKREFRYLCSSPVCNSEGGLDRAYRKT